MKNYQLTNDYLNLINTFQFPKKSLYMKKSINNIIKQLVFLSFT